MPPNQATDKDIIHYAAIKNGWQVENSPIRMLIIKANRVISVNFDPDRTGKVVSAFDGTRAIKGRMPGAVLNIIRRG